MQASSAKNPLLKEIRRASVKGQLLSDGTVVVEGPNLLEEIANTPWSVKRVLTTAAAATRYEALLRQLEAAQLTVPEHTFQQVAPSVHSQGILALAEPPHWAWSDLLGTSAPLLLVLDRIQDPGNAGTLFRSAEAFGATGVICMAGCVRVANSKFLRATAGSIFRMPFLENWSEDKLLECCQADSIELWTLMPGAFAESLKSKQGTGAVAMVVGSEGGGISPRLGGFGCPVTIPTGRVESLNAAVAGSLALYEVSRRR